MNVPEQIKQAAGELVAMYGEQFNYLGEHKGAQVYAFRFPDDASVGYPCLFLYDAGKVTEVGGEDALVLISSLC